MNGAWAVVEAYLRHDTSGVRWVWVHHPAGYWFNDFGTHALTEELQNPTQIRPGVT